MGDHVRPGEESAGLRATTALVGMLSLLSLGGVAAASPAAKAVGTAAADVAFSIEGTLPTFPCPDGCAVSFSGSGTVLGTVGAVTSSVTYEATFAAVDAAVDGSAIYTEPGPPFCPANGFAAGSVTLSGGALGVVRRSTTPEATGKVTGLTVDADYSYQRAGAVAVIEITGGTVTVFYSFPDSGPGSVTTDVVGAGPGSLLVDGQDALDRCETPGPLPFQLVGDIVLGPT